MKYHEILYLKRSTCMHGISTIIEYLTSNLIKTFHHPLKAMDDQEMYSFLCGVLQIYLEFWNSTEPPVEYIPDLKYQMISEPVKQQTTVISKISALLKHIRSCQVFPHVNNLQAMEKLEKLQQRSHYTPTRLLPPNNLGNCRPSTMNNNIHSIFCQHFLSKYIFWNNKYDSRKSFFSQFFC